MCFNQIREFLVSEQNNGFVRGPPVSNVVKYLHAVLSMVMGSEII